MPDFETDSTASPELDAGGALAAELRAAGLRVTAPRLAVLGSVRSAAHSDADTIVTDVRRRIGSVSLQAVYDVLRVLGSYGLVRRVVHGGSPALFEARVGDNHHHVVCRRCGAVADVDCALGAAPCLEPSLSHGFVLDEAEVTFWGLCPGCQSQSDHSPDHSPENPAVHPEKERA